MRSTRRFGGLSRSANRRHPAAQPPGCTETPPPPDGAEPELPAPALVIDALGRKCPIPIIWLAQRIGEVPVGAVVTVLADDPAAKTDIPSWCGMKSHDWVATTDVQPAGWAIHIRRRY
ncbi:MAG TPA: sulfurtransferase TusA family protein [Streptosporangiaceae bacterium]